MRTANRLMWEAVMKCRTARFGAGRLERAGLVLAAMVALATAGTFAATSAIAGSPRDHVKPTVTIANTAVGPLLANQGRFTVYMFVRDKHDKDKCRAIKGCEKDWPAVTTTGAPVAGPGVRKSLLGTIPYKGKLRELTYKGHPLHTYRFDTSKGSVINIGNRQFGGAWYALNAKGTVVK